MKYIKGQIFSSDGFQSGYVGFKNNMIVTEAGLGDPPQKTKVDGIISPGFVNAHTHIGDSFIKKRDIELPRNVQELVGPPDGLKHKLLSEATEHDIVEGMRESIQTMLLMGVTCFCDFREGGLDGIQLITKALQGHRINSFVLSRPSYLHYNKNEIDVLLQRSDGIGISSIADWEYSELGKISQAVQRKKKLFALHGSETVREDINNILDLHPDFVVHMVKATESDLVLLKENGVPVVICPRSNAFFGLRHDFPC